MPLQQLIWLGSYGGQQYRLANQYKNSMLIFCTGFDSYYNAVLTHNEPVRLESVYLIERGR